MPEAQLKRILSRVSSGCDGEAKLYHIMAIIYTYPKLTSPQGNELIVVSDVNNRNSTRLITIASIAALVPSGGGCGTAITGIIDLNDDPLYEATLCNDVRCKRICITLCKN